MTAQPLNRPVDVHGILERAGANPDAPEGSQAWALAQVSAVVTELIEADKEYDAAVARFDIAERHPGSFDYGPALGALGHARNRRAAALARIGGAA
jgi:hypothetical protein